jgi:hypothetical protein
MSELSKTFDSWWRAVEKIKRGIHLPGWRALNQADDRAAERRDVFVFPCELDSRVRRILLILK